MSGNRWSVALFACASVVVGCSDDGDTGIDTTTGAGAAGGSGGATTSTNPGGAGGGGAAQGGGGAAAASCEALEHPGLFIDWTSGGSTAPTPTSGTLGDGTWALSTIQYYGGTSSQDSEKLTIAVSEGGTRYARRLTTEVGGIDQSDCGVLGVAAGAVTFDSTLLPGGEPSGISDSVYFGYSASESQLQLFYHPGSSDTQTNVLTLTK